jgi:hypothetical protein
MIQRVGRYEPQFNAVREGFEPFAGHTEVAHNQSILDSARIGNTQIRAQITDALGRDLSQVVAAWSKIPVPLKAAILAIVNSCTASMEGES